MRVALVRPPNTGSHIRGIGFYTDILYHSLQKIKNIQISLVDLSFSPWQYRQFDLVHFPYFDLFYLTLPPVRFYKTLVTVHDVIPIKYPEGYPLGLRGKTIWPVKKKLLDHVDAVLTDSLASAADIESLVGINKSKVFPIHLAPDEIFKPIREDVLLDKVNKKYHLPKTFALYVGGINWNKNLPILARACISTKLPLVIVGKEALGGNLDLSHAESGPFKEVLKLIVGVDLVKCLGFVPTDDLAAIYNLASVYVQPSIDEGFGLPVLEAMSCGLPVVCGRNGSLPEIAGKAAIYVDVFNPDDMAQALNSVLSYPPERLKRLSIVSLQQAKKFSWEKTASDTVDVYNRLAENSGRSPGA